ncbi:MAG TPA: hypothetical protein PKL28_04365 [Rhodocyclaceae bacterium]|nr:hypothetical protein [Nitrospira sp.]HNM80262.1 hypothetical protein [Rhodocyclaceae bacterium]
MNQNQKMSKNERDAYDNISETLFDTSPQLAELFARLVEAKQPWQQAITASDSVRFKLEGIAGEVEFLRYEAAELDQQRPEVVGRIVVAGGDEFAADDELLARRAQLLLKAERLALARPALEQEFLSHQRRAEVEARNVMEIQDQIETLRHQLRLAAAKRQAA